MGIIAVLTDRVSPICDETATVLSFLLMTTTGVLSKVSFTFTCIISPVGV